MLSLFLASSAYSQSIDPEKVARELVADAWNFYKIGQGDPSSFFKSPTYSRDKRLYFGENPNTGKEELKKANYELNNNLFAYTYNPYPFVSIVIPIITIDGIEYSGDISICYLPVSDINQFVQLVETVTGLKYDPDISFLEDGIYVLTSEAELIEYDDDSYYAIDECDISIHEYFPKSVGGCAVELRFMGVAL